VSFCRRRRLDRSTDSGFCEPPVVMIRFFKPSAAGLLEDQRKLLDRRGDDQACRRRRLLILASWALMSCAGGSMVLDQADLDVVLLKTSCRSLPRPPAAPNRCSRRGKSALPMLSFVDDLGKGHRLDRRGRGNAEDVGIARRGDLAGGGGLDHHRHLVFHQASA